MEKDSKRRSDKMSARKVLRIRPSPKSIVLGVTGSIAAYKSAELASLLIKQGHQVFVVMTHDATEFITPLTLQTLSKNPVTTSFYDEKQSWHPGHIALADRADLLLIAPATAHIIAELAHGLAGHPLAAIALAPRAPRVIAPAVLEEHHRVTLISGPVCLTSPTGAEIIRVTTGEEMFEAVLRQLADCDVLVMCAAVCDYKPAEYSPQKMKKTRVPFALPLTP